jgi:hypothetical protein
MNHVGGLCSKFGKPLFEYIHLQGYMLDPLTTSHAF